MFVICLRNCLAVIDKDDSGAETMNSLAAVAKVLMLADAPIDLKAWVEVVLNNLPPELVLIYAGLMAFFDIVIFLPDCLQF